VRTASGIEVVALEKLEGYRLSLATPHSWRRRSTASVKRLRTDSRRKYSSVVRVFGDVVGG